MVRIYIRKETDSCGKVFKSKHSIKNDIVASLPWIGFVDKGLITEEEWAKSQQTISSKFSFYISEMTIDGRTKLSRYIRRFSWRDVLLK